MTESVKDLSDEYMQSAIKVKEKLIELKKKRNDLRDGGEKNIEERIVLLETQYGYLVRTSAFLAHYYDC